MRNVRSGGGRARPAVGGTERRGRPTTTPRHKAVSEAEIRAPWHHYERRLAAKNARRLRGFAPNFLVIAPPKTATTWVYEVLSTDRRFFMPEKECRYFSHFWREYPLSSYYAQFQNPFGAFWRGEASPSYFILPSSAIAAIREELPSAKLIVLLRDPGERLWSHARHSFMYKEGWFRSSTAWRIEEVSEAEWYHALLHPVIRAYDDYAGPLARWAEHFPAEQILMLTSEMIGAEPERAAQEIYDFLGLPKPASDSPFLRNRPNAGPQVVLPDCVAELLLALTTASRSRLEAALPSFPTRLANQLRSATSYWQNIDRPDVAPKAPKAARMLLQPEWDRLTTATFPRDLLTWSYRSIEPPANTELLHVATLNFEYSYFSTPADKEMTEQTLLRRVQAFGTSIIEHDARLSGVERTAAALQKRLSGMEGTATTLEDRLTAIEGTVEQRSERLRDLEETVDQRTERLLALEFGAEEQQLRISGLEAANAVRDQRLKQLEQTIEERSARLIAIEGTLQKYSERLDAIQRSSATRDERLAGLEQTIEERTTRLAAVERGLEEHRQRIGGIEATDSVREGRLSGLEQTLEERTGRLMGIESRLDQQEQRTAAFEANNRIRDERLSSLEATMDERTGRLIGIENQLDQQEQRSATLEAGNGVRDERLSSLERTIEERSQRLIAIEGELEELRQRASAGEAETRELFSRQSDRMAEFETQLRQQADRAAEVERDGAERKTESAEQNRSMVELRAALVAAAADIATVRADQRNLEAAAGQISELRVTIEKSLYAIALLQDSLQGVESDLSQLRLSRIEVELPSGLASAKERPNSGSLI
jgi:predicted  nucleic acid-binding Zn-ribbon protein